MAACLGCGTQMRLLDGRFVCAVVGCRRDFAAPAESPPVVPRQWPWDNETVPPAPVVPVGAVDRRPTREQRLAAVANLCSNSETGADIDSLLADYTSLRASEAALREAARAVVDEAYRYVPGSPLLDKAIDALRAALAPPATRTR